MNELPTSSFHLNLVGVVLILLSLASYFLAEAHFQVMQQNSLLLILAAFKSLLIGACFMELLHKHKLILMIFAFFFVVLAGLLSLIFGF